MQSAYVGGAFLINIRHNEMDDSHHSYSSRNSRKELRKEMRDRRRQLTASEQAYFADLLAHWFSKTPLFLNSHRIAFYISNDGELDLLPLMLIALSMKKRCFLPVLGSVSRPHLRFAPYTPEVDMRFNKFGIPEPVNPLNKILKPFNMDLVLTPLVAFDQLGNRLGMGGGYYDKTFSFLTHRNRWSSPRLVGVAHDFQKVEHIHSENWDVPLNAVITPGAFMPVGK